MTLPYESKLLSYYIYNIAAMASITGSIIIILLWRYTHARTQAMNMKIERTVNIHAVTSCRLLVSSYTQCSKIDSPNDWAQLMNHWTADK